MTTNTTGHALGFSGSKDSAAQAIYLHQQGEVPHADGCRSGCYSCFFQRQDEWIGLSRCYPELFEKAQKYEKFDPDSGKRYTWSQGTTLVELAQPGSNKSWQEILTEEGEDGASGLVCHL